jgi:hypothetical protein
MKNISEGEQEAPFDKPGIDSKEKLVRKIQTDCSDKNGGKTFFWFAWTHTEIV